MLPRSMWSPRFCGAWRRSTRCWRRCLDCDAIFVGGDVLAVGVMLEARKRGIRVPEDLAIAGIGDLDFAAQLQPALTTIKISGYDIGRTAGRLLLARLRGQQVEALEVVDRLPALRLVERVPSGGPVRWAAVPGARDSPCNSRRVRLQFSRRVAAAFALEVAHHGDFG